MAGESYALLVPPTGATFIAGHAARASQIERVRQNLAILAKPRYIDLGGCEIDGHDDTVFARLRSGKVVGLCDEDFRGLTLTLEVWLRVAAGGTVQVRLQNIADNIAVATTAAVSPATTTKATAAVTLPVGTTPKDCRLEIVVTGASAVGYAFGHLKVAL